MARNYKEEPKEPMREKITVKDLDWKGKVEHFWEYYKIHTIVTIILIIVIGNILNHYFINPPAESIFNITIISKTVNEEKVNELKDELKFLISNDKKETTSVEYYYYGNESIDYAYQMKLIAQISTNELDLIIAEKDIFNSFISSGTFVPLDDYIKDNTIKVDDKNIIIGIGENGEEQIYGFIPNNYKDLLNGQEVVVGIIANSQRKDKSIDVINNVLN